MAPASYRERSSSLLLLSRSQAVTQEFHLSITPVGQDTYWLRTETVSPGVPLAETQVTWPLVDWLAQAEALFQDPLQALMADADSRPDSLWTQLGQALYDGLFQGRIRDSWMAAQGVAQNRRQPLCLRLGFKDSRVQRLPWELLYGDDRPLATGLDVTLCRYYQGQAVTDLATLAPRTPAHSSLRVLVVISAPNDQERLALRQEVQTLIAALQTAPPSPGHLALEVTILEQPGRPELVQALEQGSYQMLHYAGHSDVSETGGDLFLVNRHTGLSDWLSGEDLAGLLVNNGIRLAVFNSCRGAYTPQDDAQAGWRDQNLVQALVNRGVPAVIAMAERIPDDVALTFTQLLYRNLHQGAPIDLCLSRVRQGLMSAYGSGQPFWMLPLLYLRPDFDGYLYASDDRSGADDGLVEAALMLPDYSADPDISSLAEEVFTRHEAVALPGADPALPLYDWLQESDQVDESAGADTAVANLVQQLSSPPTDASESILSADPAETLLPPPTAASPVHLGDRPARPGERRGSAGAAQCFDQLKPKRAVPFNLLAWVGLGLAGLGTVLALTVTTLSRSDRSTPAEPTARPELGSNQPSPGTSTALLSSAITAITLDKTATARTLVEQLLDAKDLTAAASAMAVVTEPQRLDPDIAYLRGRLAWQQWIVGSAAETSPMDAMRAWQQAVEANPDLLEAWVGLGFAHYALQDYGQAIQAWERAIAIDQSQRRDINPEAGPEVVNPITVHAYAGLAMAYQQESAITILPEEQAPFQQAAQSYFTQTLALDPTLINPNTLALTWLWAPALISDWQNAVAQLAVSGGDAGVGSNSNN
jgi:tetratricopeptide (TPR) repeat protein